MKKIRKIAWHRFSVNSSIIADGNGRFIATLFYFTVLVPFGLLSALMMDPLDVKKAKARKKSEARWHKREAVPADIKSAREQG